MKSDPTASYLMLLGAGCLIIVVLMHVCEAFHLFPVMGWGLKHSPGHYLDLIAAILGLIFLPAGFFLALADQGPKLSH